eukprot:TRINITY_DN395_c2_g1_i1.p1 TRINITY_DN395_c2_g1~~TRINITY_DN395_c2_g1_i1.p1  ORF type:complete len:297 (-),score=145.43 TRINITY_DN395_c2_g1_i1:182-1042(-)
MEPVLCGRDLPIVEEVVNDLGRVWFDLLEDGGLSDCTVVARSDKKPGAPSSSSSSASSSSNNSDNKALKKPKNSPEDEEEEAFGVQEEFSLHRLVLATRCPKLYEMVLENQKKALRKSAGGPVGNGKTYVDVDPLLFDVFVAFLYAGETLLTKQNVFALMKLAREFHVPSLHDECLSFLLKNHVFPNTIDDIRRYAKSVEDDKLFEICVKAEANAASSSSSLSGSQGPLRPSKRDDYIAPDRPAGKVCNFRIVNNSFLVNDKLYFECVCKFSVEATADWENIFNRH